MVNTARRKATWSSLALTDVAAGATGQQGDLVRKLKSELDILLEQETLSDAEYSHIYAVLYWVVQSGRISAANELIQKVTNKIEAQNSESQHAVKFRNLLHWSDQYLTEFQTEGLVDLDGNPAKFQNETAKRRVVMYVPQEDPDESVARFDEICGVARSGVRDTKFGVTLIYVFDGRQPHILGKLKVTSKEIPFLDIWIADLASGVNTHVRKYPVPKYPFFLILDEKRRVIAIDPNELELENRLFR